MTRRHMRQAHGGWATAAKRRGEEYVGCLTCGRHQRMQAMPEERYTFHWTHVLRFAVGVVMVYLLFVALIVIGTAAS